MVTEQIVFYIFLAKLIGLLRKFTLTFFYGGVRKDGGLKPLYSCIIHNKSAMRDGLFSEAILSLKKRLVIIPCFG